MTKAKRLVVKIDEDKCDGCGLCVPSCAEGAIQIIAGKARLVGDNLCDGLGACLGHCPQDAITLEEREAEAFDESAVGVHLAKVRPGAKPHGRNGHGHDPAAHGPAHGHGHAAVSGGCPGARAMSLRPEGGKPETGQGGSEPLRSELGQWPVQLALVPAAAPYLKGADLMVAADCVPLAYPDFHRKFLKGRAVVIACPKLDDTGPYVQKLADMIRLNDLNSVTVAVMEVPCCGGLVRLVKAAMQEAGVAVTARQVSVGIRGEIVEEKRL
ncbi:MAG: 4Fe-4S binding protein [Bacillota bacterium]